MWFFKTVGPLYMVLNGTQDGSFFVSDQSGKRFYYLMSEDGIEQSFPYHDAANLIVDFEINPATQGIVYLTKAGEIFEQQAAAFLIYAINPSVITLLLTLILLGISDSYGLPMQSNYYTDLDEVRRYGYDRAMGVYSLFENMSQVFGSFIFGVIYTYGVKEGLILAGGVLLALAFLFCLMDKLPKACNKRMLPVCSKNGGKPDGNMGKAVENQGI